MSSDDDQVIIEAGYQPQLRRSLGLFSSFAVSFSFISITTGIFANYGYVLGKAGPFGFWTWLLVGAGHTLVALVFAELAGRMPLTGAAYNWNIKLMGPAVGWFTGWLALSAYSIGVAAVTSTLVPVVGTIFDTQFNPALTTDITVGVILLQTLINIFGVRLTSKINLIAVYAELISIAVLGCLIAVMALHHGQLHFDLLTTIPAQPRPYLPGFLMACLLGAWAFVGFETSADMSEETINARKIAPKGVISSIAVSAILGFFFIVAMTVAIPDVKEVTSAENPLIAIVNYHLGAAATKIFMVFVVIAIFACSLLNMTAASRILYAIARDRRFVVSSLFQKISAQRVPVIAIGFVSATAILFTLLADSLTALYSGTSILAALLYAFTVIGFAVGFKKLPPTHTFSLGRWRWPVVGLAISWMLFELGILTIPEDFHSGALAAGIVVITGFVPYLVSGRKRRLEA